MHKYRMLIGIAKGLDFSKRAASGKQIKSLLVGGTRQTNILQTATAAAAAAAATVGAPDKKEYSTAVTTNNIMTANNSRPMSTNQSHKNGIRSLHQDSSLTWTNPPGGYSQGHRDRFVVSPLPNSLKVATSRKSSSITATTGMVDTRLVSATRDSNRGIAIRAKSTFPKWPSPVMESRGNYRDDAAILEPVIGGPLYSAQSSLPHLPVPELQETITTFLPTALPLAETEQEARDLMDKCRVFPQQASKLQEKLLHRKEYDMKDTSWLQLWWNTAGYLQVRDPVTINVSYYFNFKDDPTIFDERAATSIIGDHPPHLGVKRGASLLYACAEFRKMICSGEFPYERIGRKEPKTPLCSVAFKYMFHCCRIPRREMDTYKMYDPSLHTHCIVARNGRFFAVDFVDDSGNPLGMDVLEERLHQCIEIADANANYVEDDGDDIISMLGWLTSSDRDSWADAREELLRIGGKPVEHALEKLESGAFLLCLDDEKPVSMKECGDLFWTGSLSSGHNRWFDKSIQLFVTENGKTGLQGEHSMMDGMPVIALSDYITKQSYSSVCDKSVSAREDGHRGSVIDIFAQCKAQLSSSSNSTLKAMIVKAKNDFKTLITDHEQHVQSFQGYGSTLMKKMEYSPDAYAQMAIQLAVYRLHGKQVGTYEATQMRPYLHGRTETTRGVSFESAKFVKRMGMVANFNDSPPSLQEKKALLVNAVKSHVDYVTKAAKGKGVDRHFLGLSMIAGGDDQLPYLYSDPVFIKSKTWRVSTSHLTHPNIDHWGFGEVVSDGLGIAYSVKPNSCIFNIAARKEHGWTEKLSHLLEEALLEMKELNDPGQSSKL
eukprot:CAMPEP_0176487056 /NCGR_PEP_ID=MMETSP0200_2-20121128/5912_1 /TAXON_ID=947934 /ORGANISM="Chaetoceros sp., Strain GSL56" /LENGTH=829 /DNA_ID=CAMNT_0017883827 /DNA_START=759 /DNA_END=3248 /DNA_ORIENTATION=+